MHPRLPVLMGPAARREGERVSGFSEPHIAWRKSTVSDSGACVEVAVLRGSVLVRDSANRGEVTLRLSRRAWSAFLVYVRHGESGQSQG
jgi:hypothetical protein